MQCPVQAYPETSGLVLLGQAKSTRKQRRPHQVPPDEKSGLLQILRQRRSGEVMIPRTPGVARCCALAGLQPALIFKAPAGYCCFLATRKTPSPWGEVWGEGITEQSQESKNNRLEVVNITREAN